MFERLYRSSMRHGSRVLFGMAILLVAIGLVRTFLAFGTLGPDNRFGGDWTVIASQIFAVLSSAVMPFLGALLFDRLDRWLSARSAADIRD